MFGIFHALTTLIAGGISDAKIASQDAQYRQNSADLVYTDSRGQRRLRSNNQVVYDYYSQDGDYIIRGRYFTLTPTRDRINAQVAEAKERGDDTPILYYDYQHSSVNERKREVPGYRYINPMTDEIYTIYPYKSVNFYINVDTFELVRPTFDQLEFERECKRRGLHYFTWQEMQEMIHHFNGATLAARKRYFTNKNGFGMHGHVCDHYVRPEEAKFIEEMLFKSRIDKKGHVNYYQDEKRDTERIDECRA